MYGKHFESMYEGSMVGRGPVYFAVWGYVIAKTRKGRLEINPVILAAIIGCGVDEIEKVIGEMQEPDPGSRNQEQEGRKLVKEGAFQYFVPSHEYYTKIRNEDDRREYNRMKQAEHRAKKKAEERRKTEAGVRAGVDHNGFEPRHGGEGE